MAFTYFYGEQGNSTSGLMSYRLSAKRCRRSGGEFRAPSHLTHCHFPIDNGSLCHVLSNSGECWV